VVLEVTQAVQSVIETGPAGVITEHIGEAREQVRASLVDTDSEWPSVESGVRGGERFLLESWREIRQWRVEVLGPAARDSSAGIALRGIARPR